MKVRLYLHKNDTSKNDKIPYFTLKLVAEEGQDWKAIGAFWKAKSGNGYSGSLDEGVILNADSVQPYVKPTD